MSIEANTAGFEGIYEAPEAAAYLTATLQRDVPETVFPRVYSRRIIAWVRAGLSSPDLIDIGGRDLLITFEDLVSMRVIALMRALGLKWRKIRRAEEWLRRKTGYARPFAVQRVWTETEDVFAELPEMGLVAASRQGQIAFPELMAEYLQPVEDMVFVPHNGVRVAHEWSPHPDVLIHPEIQFGAPCVNGTRIPTLMLWRMHSGGDSLAFLASSFNLSDGQMESALRWEDRLLSTKSNKFSG